MFSSVLYEGGIFIIAIHSRLQALVYCIAIGILALLESSYIFMNILDAIY